MALQNIVYGSDVSSYVNRGNTGVLADGHFEKITYYISPNYFGGYWNVSETFKLSTNVNVPDGTVVLAFHALTHALVGQGTTTAGVAAFNVATSNPVYLVAVDPVSSETIRTLSINPS